MSMEILVFNSPAVLRGLPGFGLQKLYDCNIRTVRVKYWLRTEILCLSVCLSACLPVCLSACVSLSLSVCQLCFFSFLSLSLSVRISRSLSLSLSPSLFECACVARLLSHRPQAQRKAIP